jgi:hypothetical protein
MKASSSQNALREPLLTQDSKSADGGPMKHVTSDASLGNASTVTGLTGLRSAAQTGSDGDSSADFAEVLKDAGLILPKQAILTNFVHHNPWEMLQNMDFFDALSYLHESMCAMSPGERLFHLVQVDPRVRANAAVVELAGVFMDLGSAKWSAPNREKGFLYFFASLEELSLCAAWRGYARGVAKKVRAHIESRPLESTQQLSENILRENLYFGGAADKESWVEFTRAMLWDLPGWSGMFQRMELHPAEAPEGVRPLLADFAAVLSILTRSSMEHLARQCGWDPATKPMAEYLKPAPTVRSHAPLVGSILGKAPATCDAEAHDESGLQNPSACAFTDQNFAQRTALEEQFEQICLPLVGTGETDLDERPAVQYYTCIDEREESFRRHLEAASGNTKEIETFGVAGFFGLAIRYQPPDLRDEGILAPEGSKPAYTVVEKELSPERALRRYWLAKAFLLNENLSFSPVGSVLLTLFLLPFTLLRLLSMSLFPVYSRIALQWLYDCIVPESKSDFDMPYTPQQAADLLAPTFLNLGQTSRFAPIIMVFGHGSRSVNNPFDAAHNCGACGGREGGPNARLFAKCANHPEVRQLLRAKGITIPDDSWFVGGYHDTTSELVEYFDLDRVPAALENALNKAMQVTLDARGQNALERCEKFCLANVATPEDALTHVHTRSTDLGEARPELGHATNAAVILGRRELTKGTYMSRRAFLPSYDPTNDDERGTALERVITPALIVCSGISLEYLFSSTEAGAGTKVPMNLVGLFGCQQGTQGDLLVGLPTQMTEMHPPVRSLFVIDAPVSRVEAVLSRNKTIRDIVRNDWVRFLVRDPESGQIFRQVRGQYLPVGAQEQKEGEVNVPVTAELGYGKYHEGFVPFTHHYRYLSWVMWRENLSVFAGAVLMMLSCAVPIMHHADTMMNPFGAKIAVCGTVLSLASLGFARRYLHGEFMFDRFAMLCVLLLTGFNIVATASSLLYALPGWSMIGFASTFLIGSYNDRPSVKENATFCFMIYQLSDAALLVSAAFAAPTSQGSSEDYAAITVVGLLVAALLKSSQFPMTVLFVRSMEGTSPHSAIEFGALSSHAGVVLLAGTMPLWSAFPAARAAMAGVGLLTAIVAGIVSKVRADRKGATAYATAATIGLIYCVLAAGYVQMALALTLGHASYRMVQFLSSPNWILDHENLHAALGHEELKQTTVPETLYRMGWLLNRFASDFDMPNVLHLFNSYGYRLVKGPGFSKVQQYALTMYLVVLAGAPKMPGSHYTDGTLMQLLLTYPVAAAGCLLLHVTVSTTLVRYIFDGVLDFRRFHHTQA